MPRPRHGWPAQTEPETGPTHAERMPRGSTPCQRSPGHRRESSEEGCLRHSHRNQRAAAANAATVQTTRIPSSAHGTPPPSSTPTSSGSACRRARWYSSSAGRAPRVQARSLLEHYPNSRPQGAPVTDRIQAEDTHRAGIRSPVALAALDGGRLARSVGPEHCRDRARPHRETEAVHGELSAVSLGQSVNLDGGCGAHPGSLASGSIPSCVRQASPA